MKIRLFGFEIELRRETDAERRDGLPVYGWWICPACGEQGKFEPLPDAMTTTTFWPTATYDWGAFPEMRCACRRRYERSGK